VRNWVLSIEGGPLVSLAVATNLLSALTGSASGGLTIALDALRATYMRLATQHGIDPALLHRIAVMSCRNARQPGAERRRRDGPFGLRHNAQQELFRHCHGRHRRPDHRARRGDRTRLGIWFVLNLGTRFV
jgi:hypothetical protein